MNNSTTIDIFGTTSNCGPDCPAFITKWGDWCKNLHREGIALLEVCNSEEYLYQVLDSKSRNMVRKSERRGYVYKQFEYNRHLDEIYVINTSKEIRQDKPMSQSYLDKPKPIIRQLSLCGKHSNIWVGGFKNGTLRAYCSLIVLNELAIINTILGRGDELTYGIMNGLIESLVSMCHTLDIRYINYLDLTSCGEGLKRFKTSVGFQPYKVVIV